MKYIYQENDPFWEAIYMRSYGRPGGSIFGYLYCLNFLALFEQVHFWLINGIKFFQNANVWNFELGWGQSKH